MIPTYKLALMVAMLLGGHVSRLPADDWPMLGRDGTRNAVSPEKNPPLFWQIGEVATTSDKMGRVLKPSKNVKWKADLGPEVYATPVISDGLVWIGANRYSSGTPEVEADAALLRCFRERDGKLLYEYVSPRLESGRRDTPWHGLSTSPSIDGDQLWFFTNRCETVCLDIGPLKRGTGEPEVLWKTDLKVLGIHLRPLWMWPARLCSPSQPYEGRVYVTVPNGVDDGYQHVPAPEAPNLVCLDKDTGEVVWTDNSPGSNILFSEFSSPLVTNIGGRGQVIVAQGDGWVRSFNPASGALIWEFDGNLKVSSFTMKQDRHRGTWNYFLTTPVLYEERIYIGNGREAQDGEGPGRLVCIDPTKNGDISTELAVDRDGNPLPQRRIQAVDPAKGERAIANPNSGLVWEYTKFDRNGDGEIDFTEEFHRSFSNVAIKDGLLIAVDHVGVVHCQDAVTGKVHWTHDCEAYVWGSPLIVDDKVCVADDDGEVAIFRLTSEVHEPLREIDFNKEIHSSPVFANGTLYVADRHTLFAIADEDPPVKTISQAAPGVDKAPPARRPRVGVNRAPDAVFVPTPQDVVERMLKLAGVEKQDVVYDLGSGDGRIVIAAAKTYGVQAVGVEIDPELIKLSKQRVQESQLADLVTIRHEDMFQVDLSQADVVAVFLYPRLLERLRPQFAKMKPGSRIVSHQFQMPDVEPDQVITLESTETDDRHTLYLWTTPLKVAPVKPK